MVEENGPVNLESLAAEAEGGDVDVQYEMGWRHALGMEAPLDDEIGLRWLKQAADNGHMLAQNNLGVLYMDGKGVLQDNLIAFVWFNIATANGDTFAPSNRDRIMKKLTKAELQEARSISKRCWRKPKFCRR